MKVITLCGSYKFRDEMIKIGEEMTLAGNCVIMPNDLSRSGKDSYSSEEIKIIGGMHKEKIRLSDAILVVDVGGYIGDSTKGEILFAKELGKEILYYSDLKK